MNIQYSKQKKEMREDPVLDFFLKVKEWGKKNINAVLIGVLGVFVVVVGTFIFNFFQGSSASKAEVAFGTAMTSFQNNQISKAAEEFQVVADNYRTTSQGMMSAFMLGSIFLSQERYDQAISWYQIPAANSAAPAFTHGESLEGLAACYEGKGDLKKSLDYLQKALQDEKIRYSHGAIRWKIALINKSLKNSVQAEEMCRKIISDTTAVEFQENAKNLLAVLKANAG